MCSHDAIAQNDYYPRLPEIPQDVDDDEETVKIVQLVKSNEPLVRRMLILLFCEIKLDSLVRTPVGVKISLIIKLGYSLLRLRYLER